ncbi:MAG: 2-oxoglutarate dehydrogenase E1 component [Bacteroidales bacterium]|nr:2-oxoglutarate dehydrogenase E1 component [Bacteroidales bacterium]
MDSNNFLSQAPPEYIEELYRSYLNNPESVEDGWRHFFEGFEFARKNYESDLHQIGVSGDEFKVLELINEYRSRGHLFTKTNPVRTRRHYSPNLDIENFGFSKKDLTREFEAGKEIGLGKTSLSNIIDFLEETYCNSIGIEFMYIRNPERLNWVKKLIEVDRNTPNFEPEKKKFIFQKLSEAVLFEKFLHTRFPGQKRFSLEGSENLIPGLQALIETGLLNGVKEFIFGMAHRGRLNVLANILRKPNSQIFTEFAGKAYEDDTLLGDVKYHLGFTSIYKHKGKECKITLAPNPSHLEAVDPIVQGIAYGKIKNQHNGNEDALVPILIHGDAAVSAQGIIYEIIQMSELKPYHVGGSIHVVINNQIGFTTNYLDGRSSTYCTDIAKTIQSPVFHVNGDDSEAVVRVFELAFEYRKKFNKDIFIDLLSYRKYGHNEGDEPRFTQPTLYGLIAKHPNPREIYKEKLIKEAVIVENDIIDIDQAYNIKMEESIEKANQTDEAIITPFMQSEWENWPRAEHKEVFQLVETGFDESTFRDLAQKITDLPEDINFFRKIRQIMKDRSSMIEENGNIDWGMAESLAYASLLHEGHPVRISGQDVERGTFSHRHAVLTIEDSNKEYIPLRHIEGAEFNIFNSVLSEYGVLGFEYGYAFAQPKGLTIWEAQFGDFANGAQIIFDQFISSAEEKWNVSNGLVVFLPHGYEGQGSEHSSARMERFLTLAADYNMFIANITTPANLFHLLRRHVHFPFRKPLILFTPKSLLRHPEVRSEIKEFTTGKFLEVISDPNVDPKKVTQVVLCNGKVYYDIKKEREKLKRDEIAIVRVEQLYPFPETALEKIVSLYQNSNDWVWVQEEPGNMGAWSFVARNFKGPKLRLVSRPDSGSPATGSAELHKIRQEKLLEKVFGECDCPRVKSECRMLCSEKEWQFISKTNS